MEADIPAKYLWAGAAAAGALLGVYFARRPGEPTAAGYSPGAPGGGWADASAPAYLDTLISRAAPVLGDSHETLRATFLPMLYRESRGNALACHGSCSADSARGWFQIKPNSVVNTGGPVDVRSKLFDPKYNFIQALLYRNRLRKYGNPATMKIGDLRAGWRYPGLVDAPWTDPTKAAVIQRMRGDAKSVGLSSSIVSAPAFSPGYMWSAFDGDRLASQLFSAMG